MPSPVPNFVLFRDKSRLAQLLGSAVVQSDLQEELAKIIEEGYSGIGVLELAPESISMMFERLNTLLRLVERYDTV